MVNMRNVTKQYPNGAIGLQDVTLNIEPGEFVFITGKSGSGKSTFVRLLLKDIDPTSGQISIFNRNLSTLNRKDVSLFRRKVGVMFQNYHLLEKKTVYDNVAFPLQVTEKPKSHIKTLVPVALSLVGLNDKSNQYPHDLSGGEHSRTALARAIVNSPSLLIADEPTGNLDADIAWDIMCLLRDINRNGTTVIVSTHAKELVNILRKRVITLRQGRVIMDRENGKYFSVD